MVGLIILTAVVLGGLVYLSFAIKNAPIIDENENGAVNNNE